MEGQTKDRSMGLVVKGAVGKHQALGCRNAAQERDVCVGEAVMVVVRQDDYARDPVAGAAGRGRSGGCHEKIPAGSEPKLPRRSDGREVMNTEACRHVEPPEVRR